MHTEIEYATNFLVDNMKQKLDLALETCEKLRDRLKYHLEKRYENHWYSDKPMKGSAYRCINVSTEDGSVDLVLRQAAEDCELSLSDILRIFSDGLALWVDPNDVSCRLGKGAIFPIYKKISEGNSTQRSNSPPLATNVYSQRRPQQRPRSISPLQNQGNHHINYQSQYQTRPRSTTPPGFSSQDAGKLYQSYSRPVLSSDSLQKLWNTIPNTTSYNSLLTKTPATYSAAGNSKSSGIDTSYSFNQYSSYYNTAGSEWKRNYKNQQYKQSKYNNWQDDETYNRYHWSRRNVNNTMTSIASNNISLGNYSYSPRQAQEVC